MSRPHLQKPKCIKYVNKKIKTFTITNPDIEGREKENPDISWDAFKMNINRMIISYSAIVKYKFEIKMN